MDTSLNTSEIPDESLTDIDLSLEYSDGEEEIANDDLRVCVYEAGTDPKPHDWTFLCDSYNYKHYWIQV